MGTPGQAITIEFMDASTSDPGFAIVQSATDAIALTLSLRSNGDIEVHLRVADCRLLVDALQAAIDAVSAQ
jgi:hypothetical protein